VTTKLTLSVDEQVVKRAKQYAKKHKKSLSEIVTSYLDFLSTTRATKDEVAPEVLEVADDIPIDKLPKMRDPRFQHLKDKYLHE
jgi:hypothetical protein